MYFVYAIQSQIRNYIYVGISNNIKRRFHQHQDGLNNRTKAYRPFKLIHCEKFETRIQARQREKYLKSGAGKEYLKSKLIPSC